MFLLETTVTTNASGDIATGAVKVGTDMANWIGHINWAAPTWDLFIVLFFIVTVFLYGMSLGRDRIVVILVSIYMALAVVTNAPFIGSLRLGGHADQYFAFRITIFVGIFIALFFLLSRSALLKSIGSLAAGSWFQVLLFSILHVGLLVSITLSLLPGDALGHLAPLTRQVFASDGGKFVWIVLPIISMAFLKGE
jgi:hypothetical protein